MDIFEYSRKQKELMDENKKLREQIQAKKKEVDEDSDEAWAKRIDELFEEAGL